MDACVGARIIYFQSLNWMMPMFSEPKLRKSVAHFIQFERVNEILRQALDDQK